MRFLMEVIRAIAQEQRMDSMLGTAWKLVWRIEFGAGVSLRLTNDYDRLQFNWRLVREIGAEREK
jgi:hypothetical protein